MSKARIAVKMESPKNGAPASSDEDPLLSLSDVARACNMSPQTIKRWAVDGLLKFVRLPSGLYKIRRSEVNKFLGGSALNIQVD